MNRGWIVLGVGLVAGVVAHILYFQSHKPCEDDTLECRLSWIQDYLSLSPDQFEVVVELHRDRQPEIDRLEAKIQQLKAQLASLEEERIENDRIDFLAFYDYLQEKVDLDRTRDSSRQNFLTKVGSIMNSDQKERFNQLIREFKSTMPEGS